MCKGGIFCLKLGDHWGVFPSQLFLFVSQKLFIEKLSNDLNQIKSKETLYEFTYWFLKFDFGFFCVFQTEEGCVWPHTGEETDGLCR